MLYHTAKKKKCSAKSEQLSYRIVIQYNTIEWILFKALFAQKKKEGRKNTYMAMVCNNTLPSQNT